MYTHCKKCLTSRTGDVLGAKCRTAGCDGVIEEVPPFNSLVKELPEPLTCPRRVEQGMHLDGPWKNSFSSGPNLDHWLQFRSNGDRVCSYCGSLHPEDLFRLVKACATAPEDARYGSVPEIETSDKSYKIYVHRLQVRNASEGGIKFYTQHLPHDAESKTLLVSPEQREEYALAVEATKKRFERHLDKKVFKTG